MLLLTANHLAGAVVVDTDGAEHGLGVAGTKGRKLLQVVMETLGDVLEVDDSIDVEHGLCLFGLYVLIDIMLEATAKLRNVIPTERQSGSVGVAAEVDEHVATALDGRIDVEPCDASCRTGRDVALACEHHRGTKIDLGETRCHDADDALLPVLVVEHDGGVMLLALQT